jgi:eukaryotic-like serine/threonine-protein kinase
MRVPEAPNWAPLSSLRCSGAERTELACPLCMNRLVRAMEIRVGSLESDLPVGSSDDFGIVAPPWEKNVALLRMSVGGEETWIAGRPPARGTVGVSRDEPHVGTLFATRYEIQSVLGKGGMGTVYKAHDRELDELVAIKTLRHPALWADPFRLDRFKQEIRLARRITHANVLRTHDLGEWNGLKFISMEFIEGQTLEQVLESEGILPTPVALRIAKQVCAGLAAAHKVGVIHGDIKPQNIIIEPAGGLKVMDFGNAHLTDESGLTVTGAVTGTLGYMSPEQARGLRLDFSSDIYSTGIVLYEIFTGSLPFEGDTPLAVVLKHVNFAPPLPRTKNPRIDAKVAAIITKCIEKDAASRFQSVGELHKALAQVTVGLEDMCVRGEAVA